MMAANSDDDVPRIIEIVIPAPVSALEIAVPGLQGSVGAIGASGPAGPEGPAGPLTSGTTLADTDIPALTSAKISDFDTQVRTSRLDEMAAPTADVSLNSRKITGLADPSSAQDAATKAYVDATKQGLSVSNGDGVPAHGQPVDHRIIETGHRGRREGGLLGTDRLDR